MSNQKQNDWKDRELGALWAKTSNSGSSFYSGKITLTVNGEKVQKSVVMFENKNKKSDNAPDFSIYLSEDRPNQAGTSGSGGSGPSGPAKPAAKPAAKTATAAPRKPNLDDIPTEME